MTKSLLQEKVYLEYESDDAENCLCLPHKLLYLTVRYRPR